MKKSDFGVVSIFYAICFFFMWQTTLLPDEAQTYPLVLIYGLLTITTLYLLQSLYKYRRTKKVDNDVAITFKNFQAVQFFGVVAFCAGYLFLVTFLGYYCATALYLIGAMLFLRVPVLHICITLVVMSLMVYAVFTSFLKVPLPTGIFI